MVLRNLLPFYVWGLVMKNFIYKLCGVKAPNNCIHTFFDDDGEIIEEYEIDERTHQEKEKQFLVDEIVYVGLVYLKVFAIIGVCCAFFAGLVWFIVS